MYLEEFGFDNKNLNKILYRLQKVYGTKLDLGGSSTDELISIYEYYSNIKNNILQESAYNSYHSHPEYAKAMLICEAIRIFLSEIAPGRKGKKVVRRKRMSESTLLELEASEEGKRKDPNLKTEVGVERPLTTMSARKNFTDVEPLKYELKPEVKMKDETSDYYDDAGQDFEGDDLTGDYDDDRDPSMDGTPHTNFDYEDEDNWVDDKFLLEPEVGDEDDSSDFSNGEEGDAVATKVADRYYNTPGPDASDYADDRNPESIDAMMDGPGYHNEKGDVIDQLADAPNPPGRETKIGLPAEMEKGFRHQGKPTQKNGVLDHEFHQDPRTEDDEREIPDPNDLQSENNKEMYGSAAPIKAVAKTTPAKDDNADDEDLDKKVEESIAKKMIAQLNGAKGVGKLFESADAVAKAANVDVVDVLNAYETLGPGIVREYQEPEDPIYNKAMLFALDMIGNKTYREFLLAAQSGSADSKQLFKFLINKAKQMGLEDKARQFAYAAHSALLNADLKGFTPGRPVWEEKY